METLRKLAARDLNLLTVFRAIDEERHVTRAAKRLGITQPALSHALGRLRKEFDDRLFVKSSRGMVPTPRADALREPIRKLMDILEEEILSSGPFSPARLVRTFQLRTTDFIESLLSPSLLRILEARAPGTKLVTTSSGFALPKEQMELGHCDLAIAGFFGELPDGFYQQRLFSDTFLCAVRKGHPRLRNRKAIDIDRFCAERHVLIAPGGELSGKVDRILKTKRKVRPVVAGLSGFMVSGWVTSETDCLITAPSSLIRLLERTFPLQVFEPPFVVPEISIVQVWHERNNQDPAHRWLREQIREILQPNKRKD